MKILCDRCFEETAPNKLTKHGDEYLCTKCMKKALSDKYADKMGTFEQEGLSKWPKRRGGNIIEIFKSLLNR
jgi:hypothetical protein